jgi:hypothetical protein
LRDRQRSLDTRRSIAVLDHDLDHAVSMPPVGPGCPSGFARDFDAL